MILKSFMVKKIISGIYFITILILFFKELVRIWRLLLLLFHFLELLRNLNQYEDFKLYDKWSNKLDRFTNEEIHFLSKNFLAFLSTCHKKLMSEIKTLSLPRSRVDLTLTFPLNFSSRSWLAFVQYSFSSESLRTLPSPNILTLDRVLACSGLPQRT